jgi:hypothetical protein
VRCVDCVNRRRFARGVSLTWWSPFRVCYAHWLKWHARLHIAGRIALVSIGTAFLVSLVLAGVAGWYTKVAWELSHLVGR